MNAFDFNFFILPLGIIIAVLAASVYYYAYKEDIAMRRTKRLMNTYIKERAKRQKALNREITKIDKLFEDKSIDKETRERLKNVLMVMHQKESKKTIEILTNAKNNRSL